MTASFPMRVARRNSSAESSRASCGKVEYNLTHDPSVNSGLRTDVSPLISRADYGELPGPEGADVPEIPWQTGSDARRKRAGEMRGVRAVRRRLSRGRHLTRGVRKRWLGNGWSALRLGVSD